MIGKVARSLDSMLCSDRGAAIDFADARIQVQINIEKSGHYDK